MFDLPHDPYLLFQHFYPLRGINFYIFPQSPQLLFMAAQLLRTIPAPQVLVRILGESFGMEIKGHLPPNEQRPNKSVEDDPDQSDEEGRVIILNDDTGLSGFYIVAPELFLASRTLKAGRKKTQNHFKHKNGPCDNNDDRLFLQPRGDCVTATQSVGYVTD